MNELQVIEQDQSIPAKLDVAKRALAEATEDWQRIDIRDYAKAVAAATAILNRKDIQVQAANLVQDAERAIAKANPAPTVQETIKEANRIRLERKSVGEVSNPPRIKPLKAQVPRLHETSLKMHGKLIIIFLMRSLKQ